ncbi:MAG TPA: CHAT domain-containing protein [Prolixibacteraceae bacterium]|nr:CHAT domain-containing protein [Prolixibacteraceae bacterium]
MRHVYVIIVSLLVMVSLSQKCYSQDQQIINRNLVLSAKNNQADSVMYWIEQGAEINFVDTIGFGALHYSIANFNQTLTIHLIQKGASVKQLKNEYIAPIFTAASVGNLRACYLLKQHGAKLDVKDSEGYMPYDYAVNLGYLRVADFFKSPDTYSEAPTINEVYQRMIKEFNDKNYTKAYSIADRTLKIAKNELADGNQYYEAIQDWRNTIINRAFYRAAESNLTDSVKYWLGMGANIDYLDENGNTALLQAIANYNNELVEYLIEKGVTINTRTDITSPPILIAAIKGNLRACYMLWKHGADLTVKDSDNKTTAYDYAIQNGYLRVAEFLKNTNSFCNEPTFRELLFKSMNFRKNNEFNEAITFANKAYNISKEEINEKCVEQVSVLQNIIVCYNDVEDFNRQLKYYLEIVQFQKSFNGEQSLEHIQALNGLGRVYVEMGLYQEADRLFDTLFNLAEVKLSKNDLEWSSILNNQATYYRTIGNLSKAEENFIKGLEISEKSKNEFDIALYSNNLAELYSELGRYKKAEDLYKKTVEIRKNILGENNVLYAVTLSNLATVLENQYKYEGVKELYEKSLKIIENLIGEENDSYTTTLSNFANFLRTINDNNAESYFLKTLEIQEQIFGTGHPNYAITLGNYAVLLSLREEYKKAIKIGLKEVDILSKNFGFNHSSLISAYNNLSLDYYHSEDYNNSFLYSNKSFEIFMSELKSIFAFSSNSSRNNYLAKNINILNGYKAMTFNAFKKDKSYSSNEYNNELFLNSILLNTFIEIQQTILNSNDSSLINTYNKLKAIRGQINYLQFQPDQQDKITELEEKANQLDKQLTKASQAYQQNKENLNIQWQDIQKNLKEGEAAIQFISFPYYNKQWTDSTLYCALVVKPGMESPAMIPLFEKKQLKPLLEKQLVPNELYASRGTTVFYNTSQKAANGQELYQLIWEPLQKELDSVNTVYIAPSGLLHKISFSAIPIDSTRLLCDQFELRRLSSTRQLAVHDIIEPETKNNRIALFGGIDYDLNNQFWSDSSLASTDIEKIMSRGFTPDSTQRSNSFTYLEGTKSEVQNISALMKKTNYSVQNFTGSQATEDAFKKLSGQGNRVIHIATHGFFFPSEHQKPKEHDRFQPLGESRFKYIPNPLLRSGLLMAGSNRTWQGDYPQQGLEDGILTAAEISEMNLFNTELVVLSACETGLGDINNSEGVFGLQRAFKLAGAKTIIMSLWKIPDKQTSMLMQAFYKNWLSGMNKNEAFKKAQLELRSQFPEPYYWAGFVMVD